ncbi:MAG: endonuclease VII domain-containing protein [Nitrososphaera sp.]|nr:endonuclease VII domain-containing protein [Nitrososphaera sp.]
MAKTLEEKREKRRLSQAAYRKRHPDRIKASREKYAPKRKRNEETRRKDTEWKGSWRKQFPEKARAVVLKKYGLTPDSFQAMLLGQGEVCAICKGTDWGLPSPSVDHCHATDIVRGILCRACNLGLENFKDSPDLLQAACRYLERAYGN